MADEQGLKALIDSDPALNFGMTDEAIVTAVNAFDQSDVVRGRDVRVLLNNRNKWAGILDASRDVADADHGLAVRIADALTDPESTLDMTDATVIGGLDAAIGAGWFEAQDKADIIALGENRRSKAEVNGLGNVRVGTVQRAREL